MITITHGKIEKLGRISSELIKAYFDKPNELINKNYSSINEIIASKLIFQLTMVRTLSVIIGEFRIEGHFIRKLFNDAKEKAITRRSFENIGIPVNIHEVMPSLYFLSILFIISVHHFYKLQDLNQKEFNSNLYELLNKTIEQYYEQNFLRKVIFRIKKRNFLVRETTFNINDGERLTEQYLSESHIKTILPERKLSDIFMASLFSPEGIIFQDRALPDPVINKEVQDKIDKYKVKIEKSTIPEVVKSERKNFSNTIYNLTSSNSTIPLWESYISNIKSTTDELELGRLWIPDINREDYYESWNGNHKCILQIVRIIQIIYELFPLDIKSQLNRIRVEIHLVCSKWGNIIYELPTQKFFSQNEKEIIENIMQKSNINGKVYQYFLKEN